MKIYIISRAWGDYLENDSARAFGYSPIGFVATEMEAKEYVEKNSIKVTQKRYGWAAKDGAPSLKYETMESLQNE